MLGWSRFPSEQRSIPLCQRSEMAGLVEKQSRPFRPEDHQADASLHDSLIHRLTLKHLNEAGSMMGSGGIVVMDEDTDMVDIARYFINFATSESCGKCVPCREGLKHTLLILNKIMAGKGSSADLAMLESLSDTIQMTSLCGLGQTAPNPVLTTLKYFREEYEALIKEGT